MTPATLREAVEAVARVRELREALESTAAAESSECGSCGESPRDECPKSKRPCGHHCNHVWIHDACDWCGAEFGESAALSAGNNP